MLLKAAFLTISIGIMGVVSGQAPAKKTSTPPKTKTTSVPAKSASAPETAASPKVLNVSDPNAAVAIINGEKITAGQLAAIEYDWYAGPTLDELIVYKLVDQEAKKYKIYITPAEIQARMNQSLEDAARQTPKGRTVPDQLRAMGLPMSRLRTRARVQLQLEKLVARSIKLHDYIDVRHLLIRVPGNTPEEVATNDAAAKAKANKILEDIKAGKKFEDAVKENSDDSFSKAGGGDLFFRKREEMDPEFAKVAFKLKAPGEIAGPVKTQQGYHLIQLIAFGDQASAEQKKQIRTTASSSGMQDYVRNLQEKAQITNVYVPYLKPSQLVPAAPSNGPGVRPRTTPGTLRPQPIRPPSGGQAVPKPDGSTPKVANPEPK